MEEAHLNFYNKSTANDHPVTGLRHRGPEDLLAGIEQLGDFFEIHGITPCGFIFYSILQGGINRDKEKNKIRQDLVN